MSKENQTFHDNTEKFFNKLPLIIREESNYKILFIMTKKFFHDRSYKNYVSINNCHVTTSHYLLPFLVCVLLKLLFFTNVHDT